MNPPLYIPVNNTDIPAQWANYAYAGGGFSNISAGTVVEGPAGLWDLGYIPNKANSSHSNTLESDYSMMRCPSRFDRVTPNVPASTFYVARRYWDHYAFSSYNWMGSAYFTGKEYDQTNTLNWDTLVYYVNLDKMDTNRGLLSDTVGWEYDPISKNYQGQSWDWTKQSNHFDVNAFMPYGGNAYCYDGHGQWVKYDSGQYNNSNGSTGTWTYQWAGNYLYPVINNTMSTPANRNDSYFFSNAGYSPPGGALRGVLLY